MPIPIRRFAYRVAYRLLEVAWLFRGRAMRGVKCVLTDADRVLLVRHSYGPRDWTLPGGAIRPREAPDVTATREIREELGIAVPRWRALGKLTVPIDRRRDTVDCFHAEVGCPQLMLAAAEILAAEWFARGSLPRDLSPWVAPLLELAS
jgi:8-oxo-dGTP pyrophosphatase MutT (NUDIX family)